MPEFNEAKFKDWMRKVDEYLLKKIGLTHLDLPDCCYADWFESRMTARGAANQALRQMMD